MSKKGFSLLEVLVAMFILTFGILGTLPLFMFAIDTGRECMVKQASILLARSKLDEIKAWRYPGGPVTAGGQKFLRFDPGIWDMSRTDTGFEGKIGDSEFTAIRNIIDGKDYNGNSAGDASFDETKLWFKFYDESDTRDYDPIMMNPADTTTGYSCSGSSANFPNPYSDFPNIKWYEWRITPKETSATKWTYGAFERVGTNFGTTAPNKGVERYPNPPGNNWLQWKKGSIPNEPTGDYLLDLYIVSIEVRRAGNKMAYQFTTMLADYSRELPY